MLGRHRVVERLRLFVEGQLRPLQQAHARLQGLELPPKVRLAQHDELVSPFNPRRRDARDEPSGVAADVGQRPFLTGGRILPGGGTVKRVDVVGVVLTDGQHESDVLFCDVVHGRVLRSLDANPKGHDAGQRLATSHLPPVTSMKLPVV